MISRRVTKYELSMNIVVKHGGTAIRLRNCIANIPDPEGYPYLQTSWETTEFFKTSINIGGQKKDIVAGKFRFDSRKHAKKLHDAIAKIVTFEEFQDIERTWLTVELVYETRWDCRSARLTAV